jgi:hypothetical protein
LGARIEPQQAQEPTARAGNNAAGRRNRAFRSCLALATMLVHERHMQSAGGLGKPPLDLKVHEFTNVDLPISMILLKKGAEPHVLQLPGACINAGA